jgi:hypothetical protein
MIEIPMSPHYGKNLQTWNSADALPCVVCGKTVRNPKHYVHFWTAAYAVMESEVPSLDVSGDMGHYPVGSDCLRQHPELKPYVQDAKRVRSEETEE